MEIQVVSSVLSYIASVLVCGNVVYSQLAILEGKPCLTIVGVHFRQTHMKKCPMKSLQIYGVWAPLQRMFHRFPLPEAAAPDSCTGSHRASPQKTWKKEITTALLVVGSSALTASQQSDLPCFPRLPQRICCAPNSISKLV